MDLLLLTPDASPDAVIESLTLLPHDVQLGPVDTSALVTAADSDLVIVDARTELANARNLCRLLSASGARVVAAVLEGSLVAVNPDWGIDDFLLPGIGPAELDARLRMAAARGVEPEPEHSDKVTLGELVIDENTYTARLRGKPIDLTYKEFELLKHLAQNPGRVFTRAQLLQEVWGYDFFGGTRTVDVHVRRLRAKLGSDHESLIGTVRNVGYKAVKPSGARTDGESRAGEPD